MQYLDVIGRLFPDILDGKKTSTIRWREAPIEPGLMEYRKDGNRSETTVVWVTRITDVPLSEAAAFVGRADEWPPDVMLSGMREHYPNIELSDIVQVVEHMTPGESQAMASEAIQPRNGG